MQNTEASCEESERVIKRLKTGHASSSTIVRLDANKSELDTEHCLFSKLLELHCEECSRSNEEFRNGLRYNSFLLEKLVKRERLNTLILNLYPGNKGFTMAFRTLPRTDPGCDETANMIETVEWTYEDDDILRYIDNEELPPMLVDVFEMHHSHLFYSGCIIAEIRDYRQAYPLSKCDIHHVLLRPTLKSIMADINNLMETKTLADEREEWSIEERHMLESQILLANNPHVCLDPDSTVSVSQLRLNYSRNMWNTHKFRRMARKFSQVTVNRKRKLDQFAHIPGLELFDYINRVRTKSKESSSNMKIPKVDVKPIPAPNLDSPAVAPPTQGVVINKYKAYQPIAESSDCLPHLVEEYILETVMPSKDKNKPRIYHIKLSILQRPSNSEYLGELYLDRDHKENERNGVACRFTLGSRTHVNKYIHQFTETFTKSGRQTVLMKHGRNPAFSIGQWQFPQQTQTPSSSAQPQQQILPSQQQQQQQQVATISSNHIVNGIVTAGLNIVQNQTYTSTSSSPALQGHLQPTSSTIKPAAQTMTNQELEINALAIKLMNYGQQFQAKQQQEQQRQQQQQQLQKPATSANNTIINLLNSSPASKANSDASAVVVNAINNSSLLPQQIQQTNVQQQKVLTSRKMTLMNLPTNARVLSHAGNLVINNNRYSADLSQLSGQQQQTITLTSVNSNESFSFAEVSAVKQQVISQRIMTPSNDTNNKQTALSALLVGTPAADRPDIVASNANSLLLEKLASSSSSNSLQGAAQSFLQSPTKAPQQQFVVQSSKIANLVKSPLSSPPSSASKNTINVQSVKLSQLQSIAGLPNVQFQLPISLSLNGNLQGHPTGLLVSVPVTSAAASSSQAANNNNGTGNSAGPTVVLANAAGSASLAQIVSGMKSLNQQNIRQGGPATVSLAQGQQFQLITSLQNPRLQQATLQQNLTARTIQRTPITIKMATTSPNANASQVTVNVNALNQHVQEQAELHHLYQQQKISSISSKQRRRNTSTEPQ